MWFGEFSMASHIIWIILDGFEFIKAVLSFEAFSLQASVDVFNSKDFVSIPFP